MRLKFFTLASSCLCVALTVQSQSPSPTPKVGYIRFWDMLPPASGAFELRKADAPASEAPLFTGTAYRYTSYNELPVGKYRFALTKKGSNAPLRLVDVDLKQNSYYTLLIAPNSIEMIDDTEDPTANSATLTVRNFFAGSSVSVWSGSKQIINALPYGQSFSLAGLSFDRTTLVLRSTLPNGKPAESSAEVDFKIGKRATALVIPDSYGRFRPRVIFDGKNL